MASSQSYIQYGVPSDWANKYVALELSITAFKRNSSQNLIERFGLKENEIDFVKKCLKRSPVDSYTLQSLLENNRFVCCLCRGNKSDAYIIHHIEPYHLTQNNNYNNLAVLCPNDHDLAHRDGEMLTSKITKEQIIKAKARWEKEVEKRDVQTASSAGDIDEIDYINIPRVVNLFYEVFKRFAFTEHSEHLIQMGFLNEDGNISSEYLKIHSLNPHTRFNFFGPKGSWVLSLHFTETFKEILAKVNFIDLDDLLTKKKLQEDSLIGSYCYYVGGLYGNSPKWPITNQTEATHLYFHRRSFFVEWKIDPIYLISNTSIMRLSERTVYLVYGRIRNVGIKEWNNKKYIHVDIRPYMLGLPKKTKSRKPAIQYIDKYSEFNFEEDEEPRTSSC